MKHVLITGCSSGFGRLMVPLFLARGWRVFATVRRREGEGYEALQREVAAYPPGRLEILELDLRSTESRAALKERMTRDPGAKLDCLVNNAGLGLFGPFEPTVETQLREQFEVNFFGPAMLIKDLLPMLRASKGRIINLSSVFGFSAFPLTGAYCASKFALEGLSESLAHELKPHGVQVSLVQPGGHRTKFGDNIAWVQDSSTVYERQLHGQRSMYRALAERKPVPGEGVALKVIKLAEMRRMPMRVLVGKDAKATWWLRRFLPHGLFLSLQSKFVEMIFSKSSSRYATTRENPGAASKPVQQARP